MKNYLKNKGEGGGKKETKVRYIVNITPKSVTFDSQKMSTSVNA